jgi:hypothetical protein
VGVRGSIVRWGRGGIVYRWFMEGWVWGRDGD